MAFAEYDSGGTITGTTSQTCSVSGFNNGVTGATGTLTLTGTNTIAQFAVITITAGGTGGTQASPPTTATLSNGTATCSGTINLDNATIGAWISGISSSVTTPASAGQNPDVALAFTPFNTTGPVQYLFENGSLSTYNIAPATSGANQAAPPIRLLGAAWNGTASQTSTWALTPSLAAGANPAATLALGYTGPGMGTLVLPANTKAGANQVATLAANGGTTVDLNQLGSGTPAAGKYVDGATGAWTPVPPVRAGTVTITAATSQTVTFSPAMTVTPDACLLQPTSDSTAAGPWWLTSLNTSGFTANIKNSATITFYYSCFKNNSN